ncbi:PHP domain-containing protein [Ketobacter sp. MCCC 1A13808]|uniref:PHP domain-containing protein n=1 Tax=Ketobacter sp. MCCC 1A13808 TaxID=2602738 RepID=UPI0012EB5E32|nr:PHP domain-containing protein [Ketobacter sp. MCCC 1A13808]MVF12875.1 PHP domain-containing protein [Ketobacter sp. MCCC 1A13808]
MQNVASEVDFHLHTTASDGELTPTELVEAAVQAGVTWLAVTDHDTVAAVPEMQALCSRNGITLVAGVEISSRWQSQDIHVVGLGVDIGQPHFKDHLAAQMQRRRLRALAMGERLEKLGIQGVFQAAAAIAPQGIPARPHFAQALVGAGVCKDRKQAFQRYLAVAKPAYVKTDWPELEQVVNWISAAGGVAVLAHPGRYKLTRTKLGRLVEAFCAAGGQCLEVAVATHSPDMVQYLAGLCVKFGLYASQGSDYHGPSMRWVQLGKMPPLPSCCRPVRDIL